MHVSNPRSLGETGEFANSAYLSIYNAIFLFNIICYG